MESLIGEIIQNYGPQLWLAFASLVATSFMMITIKNFINDLVLYFKVRMSDLGRGAMILWRGKLKMVEKITFKHIEVYDDEEVVLIPIKNWMHSDRVYPKPWDGQFNEEKWKHWDGKKERRKS